MSEVNLFCIPYAGGIADAIYGKWRRYLGEDIRVYPLDPAGHGRRMKEPLHPDIGSTVEAMFMEILPIIEKGGKYAIYGHSIGSIIAYELGKRIAKSKMMEPVGLFISGRFPPDYVYPGEKLYLLGDQDFIHELTKVDGSPQNIYKHPELVASFLPVIRNDYKIVETYTFEEPKYVLNGFITCLHSSNDSLVAGEAFSGWKLFCNGEFKIHRFIGHHFFINEQTESVCKIIKEQLYKYTV